MANNKIQEIALREATSLLGKKFHKLTALELCGKDKHGTIMIKCKCECGKEHITKYINLKNGRIKSCGCISKEINKKMFTTHGCSKSPAYHIWINMMSRCYDSRVKSYKLYGGRGITVCDEWKNLKTFTEWYETNLKNDKTRISIDRIDTNGNYCPENCRLSNMKEQQRNRRNNNLVHGVPVTQFAEENNLPEHYVRNNSKKNWTKEEWKENYKNRRKPVFILGQPLHEFIKETGIPDYFIRNHSPNSWTKEEWKENFKNRRKRKLKS